MLKKINFSKRTNSILALLSILFIALFFLGSWQSKLTADYSRTIKISEKMIFQTATARDHLIELIMNKDWQKSTLINSGIEQLNNELSAFIDTNLVPQQYTLNLSNQLSISKLALLSRKLLLTKDKDKDKIARTLLKELQNNANYLMQFERIIIGQLKSKIVHFQTTMIGILSIIIACFFAVILYVYQRFFLPFERTVRQLNKFGLQSKQLSVPPNANKQIRNLINIINQIIVHNNNQLATNLNQEQKNVINEHANGIINYANFLQEEPEIKAKKDPMLIVNKIITNSETIKTYINGETNV